MLCTPIVGQQGGAFFFDNYDLLLGISPLS